MLNKANRIEMDYPVIENEILFDRINSVIALLDSANICLPSDLSLARKYISDSIDLLSNSEKVTFVSGKSLSKRQVEYVKLFIEQHIDKTLSVDLLASVLYMTPSRFTRSFKLTSGISPTQFIRKARFRKACLLMLSTSQSLIDITYQVGLYDQAHLTKLFREFTNETPFKWRKKHQNHGSLSLV